MKKYCRFLRYMLVLITFYTSLYTMNSSILTFFIQQYPLTQYKKVVNPLAKITKLAGKVPETILLTSGSKTNNGIFVVYYGYISVSNLDGQVIFPFKGQKPEFKLLVTPSIKPVVMIGNTLHHWELMPNIPTKIYSVNLEQDEQTQLYYWKVADASLPTNNVIATNTITILAHPESILIPTGITLSSDNTQLVLPTIYAKNTINRLQPAFNLLKVRQFLGPIFFATKKQKDTYYAQQITTNPSE